MMTWSRNPPRCSPVIFSSNRWSRSVNVLRAWLIRSAYWAMQSLGARDLTISIVKNIQASAAQIFKATGLKSEQFQQVAASMSQRQTST
jgi:hypothetical protein